MLSRHVLQFLEDYLPFSLNRFKTRLLALRSRYVTTFMHYYNDNKYPASIPGTATEAVYVHQPQCTARLYVRHKTCLRLKIF